MSKNPIVEAVCGPYPKKGNCQANAKKRDQVQCNALQHNAMQCSAMQCNVGCNATSCNAMQCNKMQLPTSTQPTCTRSFGIRMPLSMEVFMCECGGMCRRFDDEYAHAERIQGTVRLRMHVPVSLWHGQSRDVTLAGGPRTTWSSVRPCTAQ